MKSLTLAPETAIRGITKNNILKWVPVQESKPPVYVQAGASAHTLQRINADTVTTTCSSVSSQPLLNLHLMQLDRPETISLSCMQVLHPHQDPSAVSDLMEEATFLFVANDRILIMGGS